MDRQTLRAVEERTVTINEVDMKAQPAPIIVGIDQYGTRQNLSTDWMGPVITIPEVGEIWIIKRRGANWYLVAKHTNPTDLANLPPGTTIPAFDGFIHYDHTSTGSNLGPNTGDTLDVTANGAGISFTTVTGANTTDGSISLQANADVDSLISLQNNSGVNGGILINNNATMGVPSRDNIYIVNNTDPYTGKSGIKIENNRGDMRLDNNSGNLKSFVNGLYIIENMPTSDPSVTNALWNDGGAVVFSGSTGGVGNYSGGYSGNAVTIANGANVALTWNTNTAGSAVLNLSTPTAPTVTATGYWSANVTVYPTVNLTVGGYYYAQLTLVDSGGGPNGFCQVVAPLAATGSSNWPITLVVTPTWMTSGSGMTVNVVNKDGSASRTFGILESNISYIP